MVETEVMGVDEGEDKGERGEKRNEEHGDTVKVRVNTNVLQLAVQFNSLGNHQTEPYKKNHSSLSVCTQIIQIKY